MNMWNLKKNLARISYDVDFGFNKRLRRWWVIKWR